MPTEDTSTPYIKTDLQRYKCPVCGWECDVFTGNCLTVHDHHINSKPIESTGRVCMVCLIRWLREHNALTIMEPM